MYSIPVCSEELSLFIIVAYTQHQSLKLDLHSTCWVVSFAHFYSAMAPHSSHLRACLSSTEKQLQHARRLGLANEIRASQENYIDVAKRIACSNERCVTTESLTNKILIRHPSGPFTGQKASYILAPIRLHRCVKQILGTDL